MTIEQALPTIFVDAAPATDLGVEARRLSPVGAARATIDWSLPAEGAEHPVPPIVARILCRALLASGRLAFRCDAAPKLMVSGDVFLAEPASSVQSAVKRLLLVPDMRFGTLATSNRQSALALFAFDGWTEAQQAALVIDPEVGEPVDAVYRLQRVMDWRDYTFPPYARALFGCGHDGAFSILACPDAEVLGCILVDLERFATDEGINVEAGPFRPR